MNERRLGIVRVDAQLLIDAVKGQHVISGDLPDDARAVSVDYDIAYGGLRILCESSQFAPVLPGEVVSVVCNVTSKL